MDKKKKKEFINGMIITTCQCGVVGFVVGWATALVKGLIWSTTWREALQIVILCMAIGVAVPALIFLAGYVVGRFLNKGGKKR